MSFDDLIIGLNASCLSVCGGQSFSYTRVTSSPEDEPGTFIGIPDTGAEPESFAPGVGTTYLKIWGAAELIALALQKGDQVSMDSVVYKIVDMDEDAGSGLWLLLRKDLDIS